jgi:pentatricopeptide repeat protein
MQSIDNKIMRHRKIVLVLLVLLFPICNFAAEGFPDLGKIYQEKSNEQGDFVLRKAENFFQDRNYTKCVEELKTFALIYPFHPRLKDSWKVLSRAYQKQREFELAIQAEMAIYLEFPTHKEGFDSFLEAGRSHLKQGDWDMAERIFDEIKKQSYFPEIAREAEIELKQMKILRQMMAKS